MVNIYKLKKATMVSHINPKRFFNLFCFCVIDGIMRQPHRARLPSRPIASESHLFLKKYRGTTFRILLRIGK
eukprot:SAG31_NODE_6345_length_2055_cov_1.034765_1_plen_71_part_10